MNCTLALVGLGSLSLRPWWGQHLKHKKVNGLRQLVWIGAIKRCGVVQVKMWRVNGTLALAGLGSVTLRLCAKKQSEVVWLGANGHGIEATNSNTLIG